MIAVSLLGLFVAGEAHAQAAVDAGTLLRDQERRLEGRGTALRGGATGEDGRGTVQAAGAEQGPTILLRGLRFSGRTDLLAADDVAAIEAAAIGRRVGLDGLREIAARVTLLVQSRGHLLARALLPPQDVTEGFVEIAIAEGALEAVEIERAEGARISADLLSDIAAGSIRADALLTRDLEGAVLRMNDLPGVSARARLREGSQPNTSRLVIDVEQEPVLRVTAAADNYGTPTTGRLQGDVVARVRDLTGYGDETRLQGTFSQGTRLGRGSLRVPVWATAAYVSVDYTWLQYRNIDAVGRAAGLNGHSHQVGLGLDYAILRSRDVNLGAAVGLRWKALYDDSLAGVINNKRVVSGTFALNGDWRDASQAISFWTLSWTHGRLDLSRVPAALAADAASVRTQGSYSRANASFGRLQPLPGDFSLFGHVSGQWADRNLDSSEKFSLGGPFGVRAYPVGEARGDMGVIGTLELRYRAPIDEEWGTLELSGFLDAGHVWLNRNPAGLPIATATGRNSYGLASAGVGLRWTNGDFLLQASWAHALGSNPGRSLVDGSNADGRRSRHSVWVTSALSF